MHAFSIMRNFEYQSLKSLGPIIVMAPIFVIYVSMLSETQSLLSTNEIKPNLG